MKAIAFEVFGGPEVIGVRSLPTPEPSGGEVRIRVRAAAVNHADINMRRDGASGLLKSAPPWVPGMDAAGTIESAGDSDFSVGDAVMAIVVPFGRRWGAQAEYVVVPAQSVAPMPKGMSFEAASALPMNAMTAHLALSVLPLPPGSTVAVTGAAGVLGGYVGAIATDRGLNVIGDAAPADVPLVKESAAQVVQRGPGLADRILALHPGGVDGVIDTAGIAAELLPALSDGGTIVAAAMLDAFSERERGIKVEPILVGSYARNNSALRDIARLAERKVLRPRIISTHPPEDISAVHRRFEGGGLRGRLVIAFDGDHTELPGR